MAIGADERRIIELVLKATGDRELKRIQSELSSLRQSAEATQASLAGLSNGFQLVAKVFAGLQIGQLAEQAIRGIISVTAQAVEEMDALATSVAKTGVAAGDLQKLQYAATLSNVEVETLNKGMQKLAVNMADVSGKGSAATESLRAMGITASTGLVDAMRSVADQFAKMPDGAEKTAKAVQLFGKAGAELIPLLNEGSAGIAELTQNAVDMGIVLSGETLAAAQGLDDAMVNLGLTIDADIKKIVGGMAPALTTLTQMTLGAITSTVDFASAGEALGDAIIDATGAIARSILVVGAWADGVTLAGDAASLTFQALGQVLQGNLGAADDLMVEAKAAADASAYLFEHALEIGKRREAEIHAQHEKNKKVAREQGAELERLRGGGGGEGSGSSAGSKGKAGAKAKAEKLGATSDDAAADREILRNATELADAYFKARAELAKYIEELERAADPTIEYNEQMAILNQLYAEGRISAEAYRVERERLDLELEDSTRALEENSKATRDQKKAQEEQQKAMDKAREQWGFVGDAAAQATYDRITGTEKIGKSVKRMVAVIIAEFIRMQAIKAAAKIIGKFFNVDPTMLTSASGNAFGSGGVISVPTAHGMRGGGIGIAGEAGPEAILPLQRNAAGQLGVAASGGSNVTVNNYAGADIGVRDTPRGLEIDVIRRQLAADVRQGGSPFATALEQTYRVGRQASAT